MKIIFLFLVTVLFAQNDFKIIEDQSNLTILTPSFKRETVKLELKNGLQVYLVSDETIDHSAAALSVDSGSWQDPNEYPGMAHLVEHLLFSGTKAYPKSEDFMRFIWERGGQVNAFTGADMTVYSFSIENDSFEQAVDRFANFFISPLFSSESFKSELEAIDQEHAKNIEHDGWRVFRVLQETANPNHPFSHFSTGCTATLKDIPQESIKKWFRSHYGANRMRLVVYSPIPKDKLIRLAVQKFGDIPSSGNKTQPLSERISSKAQEGHIICIKPVKILRNLTLEWELPAKFANDDSKSAELLSYGLKRSSLGKRLKEKNLIESFDASVEKMKNVTLFSTNFSLTEKGEKAFQTVIKELFEELLSLRNLPSWITEEKNSLAKLAYEFQKKDDAYNFVTKNAVNLLREDLSTYPKKTIIAAGFDEAKIKELFDNLGWKNCKFVLLKPDQKNYPHTKKEQWMGAEYVIRDLPKKLTASLEAIEAHSEDIKPNPFIPKNLALQKEEGFNFKNPHLIASNGHGKAFFAKDDQFFLPESVYLITVKSPVLDKSSKSTLLSTIYQSMVVSRLESTLSAAEEANLHFRIFFDDRGFNIFLSGWSDTLPLLLKEVIKNLKTTGQDFEYFSKSSLEYYLSTQKDLPFLQANRLLHNLLNFQPPVEEIIRLSLPDEKEFIDFEKNLFEKSYLEAIFTGNMTLKEAEGLWVETVTSLSTNPYPEKEQRPIRTYNFPESPIFLQKETKTRGCGVVMAIQETPFSLKKQASLNVLSSILQGEFFTSLRTKQKTAYAVKSWNEKINDSLEQIFVVQSKTHPAEDLLIRFDIFLENFSDEMDSNVPESRFEESRKSLLSSLSMPPKNLEDVSLKLREYAFEYGADFNMLEKQINSLKTLSYNDFVLFSKKFLNRLNKKRLAISFEGPIERTAFEKRSIEQLKN